MAYVRNKFSLWYTTWVYASSELYLGFTTILVHLFNHFYAFPFNLFFPFFLFSGRTGILFDQKDVIILTDSTDKNFRHLLRAVPVAVPGATISSLIPKLQNLKLSKYKVILALVGTNDPTLKSIWVWYKMKLRKGHHTLNNLARHPKL